MLHAVVATALQDVTKTHLVGLDIGSGIRERVTHPSLGREVDHTPGLGGSKQGRDRLAIGEIQTMEAPGLCASTAGPSPRGCNAIQPIQPR